jgi:hypothetical protein
MIKLVIALTVSFLVVVFYFFGVKWGLIVSAILIITSPFIAFTILKITKSKTGGTPGTKKPRWIIWLIVVLAVIAITWGITASQCKKAEKDRLADIRSRSNMVHPTEEWIFVWSLPPNQYDERGSNGDNLEVRIVKNDSESLCFDTHYIYAGSMETGRNQLSKHGDKMVGSWCQDNPRDGGSIYLKKADDQTWFGKFEDQKGRTYPCMLKRK